MNARWAVCLSFALLLFAPLLTGQTPVKSDSVLGYIRTADGASVRTQHGLLELVLCGDSVVHITYTPTPSQASLVFFNPKPWIAKTTWPAVPFTVTKDPNHLVILSTTQLRVTVERDSSAVVFQNGQGRVLVRESASPAPREVVPVTVDSGHAFRVSAYFDLTQDEALYGLGQHQTGLLNQRGIDLLLMQDNTNITIPFLISSRGYGLLWNNASLGRYENHYQPKLALRADIADAVDYYFVYGPQFDRIVARYRTLTGAAPMLPLWAYGFWQSRYQYRTQQEMLEVAARYRELKIPLDNLVLDFDWMQRMGSNQFTPGFPDPAAMFSQLRDMHIHTMISVWPFYTPPGANFDAMSNRNYFVTGGRTQVPSYYPGSRLLDAFNSDARKMFWQQIKTALYDKGVAAWWLDSSEPLDFYGEQQGPMLEGARIALGSGTRYANSYPFFETQAVYEGQRTTTDNRVFILTRSGFLGQQSHAAASWSGDTAPTFDSLQRQVPAGLNYSMSGLPYWTTDIGGFLGGDPRDPAYQELYVRWFEYGTFCPIFRTHGARSANELWSYGPKAQPILTLYDNMRYRLLPYIYSVAWRTTAEGDTPMRALAMDFAADRNALVIPDEFMYGPALLISPVLKSGATSRSVYLPAGPPWYDFWTGTTVRGGESITVSAPLETIPICVRAGSIIPMGPALQHTDEKPEDPIELRIYPGADGSFELFEDDGLTYAYEKGQYATVVIHWNDTTRMLTLEDRKGSFLGMLKERTFQLVVVGRNHGVGEAPTAAPDGIVHYDGSRQTIRLR